MIDTSNMPTYECHKRVHALEVAHVGDFKKNPEMGYLVRTITFVDGTKRDITEQVFRRTLPERGWFYVVYDDGEYESFSPGATFLSGYKPVDDRTFRDIKAGLNTNDLSPRSHGGYPAAGGAGSATQHPKGQE